MHEGSLPLAASLFHTLNAEADDLKFSKAIITPIRQVAQFLRPMRIPLHSAYTCFFLILSLFPGLLLLLGLLRYTSLGVDALMALLVGWLPQALLPTATMLMEASYRHSSGMVVSISVVAALYSASRGMFGIVGGLNAVYRQEQGRSYWRKRGISMVYTATFLLLLIVTLVLHIFGTALLDFLWMTTDPAVMAVLSIIDFRAILLLALLSSLFAAMYAWLPHKRNRLRHSLPGAVAAAAGWLIFSRLFSVYVEYFTMYANIYGSIYALALGMLWLYFCISIFFYGGALNFGLEQRRSTL